MTSKYAAEQQNEQNYPVDVIGLEKIMKEAGNVAKSLFARRSDFRIDQKSPGQFVTEADRIIEKYIRQAVRQAFGDRPVVGEEYGGSFDGEGWVIDPIDGTSNFLCGIPLWSISVAYMSNHVPVLGAVYAPDLDMLASAAVGRGLRLNQEPFTRPEGKTAVPTFSVGENTVWARDDVRRTTDALREDGFEVLRLRSASQSLAMAGIGMVDGYIEEHLKLWDIAAGWLICLEGGLPVTVIQHEGHERSIWAGEQT